MDESPERGSCSYRVKVLHRTGCAPPDNCFPWGDSLLGLAECENILYSKKRSATEGVKLESLKGLWDRVKHLHRTCCAFCGESLLEIAEFQKRSSMEGGMKLESLERVCRRAKALDGSPCAICGEMRPRISKCHKSFYSMSSMGGNCGRTCCASCADTRLGISTSTSSMAGMKLESLERACDRVEARHMSGDSTADDWFTWGEALLGIAECQNSLYSKRLFIDDSIQKLRSGLFLGRRSNPHANWCLGKAYVACGLASPDRKLAYQHFLMASHFFENAASLDPCNEKYLLSLHLPREAKRGPNGIFVNRNPVENMNGVIIVLSFLGVFVALSATLVFKF